MLEIHERQALGVLADFLAGKPVEAEKVRVAREVLSSCRCRQAARKVAVRKFAKRKAARAATDAAKADPVRQMEQEAAERIGRIWADDTK